MQLWHILWASQTVVSFVHLMNWLSTFLMSKPLFSLERTTHADWFSRITECLGRLLFLHFPRPIATVTSLLVTNRTTRSPFSCPMGMGTPFSLRRLHLFVRIHCDSLITVQNCKTPITNRVNLPGFGRVKTRLIFLRRYHIIYGRTVTVPSMFISG